MSASLSEAMNDATRSPSEAGFADLEAAEQQAAEEARALLQRLEAAAGQGEALAQKLEGPLRQLANAPDGGAALLSRLQSARAALDLGPTMTAVRMALAKAVLARREANARLEEALVVHTAGLAELNELLRTSDGELTAMQKRAPKPSQRPPVPPPVPHDERRRARRVHLNATIDWHSEDNFYTGFSTDLSSGGLFIATIEQPAHGTRVDLAFTLPTGKRIEVEGEVRWSRNYNDATPLVLPGVGVQFVNLSPEAAQAIAEFVAVREPLFFVD